MTWNVQPVVAREYLADVAKQFEAYTEIRYAFGLRSSDPARLLGSLKYVETRKITGHDTALRELFMSPRAALADGKIAATCLDAMLTICESRT